MLEDDKARAMSELPPAGDLPQISLIIPSRNRPDLLRDTIRSILDGDRLPTELIIVDQSDAPNRSLAHLGADSACQVRYLWLEKPGVSRARNQGIAAAQHEVLVFTDDDVLVTASWLGALVGALGGAGSRSAVTGRVLPADAERPGGFVPSTIVDPRPAVYQGRVGQDVLFSNNMALPRAAVEEIGGFDQRLGAGTLFSNAEDNDFGFRLLEAGYRILYVPEAVLYHRAWRSEQDYLPLRWSYGRGQGAYFAKHLSLRDRYMLWRMLRHIKNHAFGFAWRVWRQRRLAYGDAVYLLGLVSSAAQWLLTQHWARGDQSTHIRRLFGEAPKTENR